MKLIGLSRQIALSMAAMALGVTLLVVLGSYVFYFLALTYWPALYEESTTFIPTAPELVWMIVTTLAAVALAVVVAVKLSRRILVPLNSVAESLRRVAQGDWPAE